jgi:hypothetical protein
VPPATPLVPLLPILLLAEAEAEVAVDGVVEGRTRPAPFDTLVRNWAFVSDRAFTCVGRVATFLPFLGRGGGGAGDDTADSLLVSFLVPASNISTC